LIISVDELVLQFANLVEKDAKFVGDIRDVVVTALAPD
jgi:hypothetical protein